MTMAKLAELAGVSVSTVSKAFSGSREISDEKREFIFSIARENGCYDKYCKDEYNGIVIAVICPEYKSGTYSEMLSFMEDEIKKHGGIMICASNDFNTEKTRQLFRFFSEYSKVDGIISLGGLPPGLKCSIPVVVMGKSDTYHNVVANEEDAFLEAVKTLKRLGHTKIAFVGEKLSVTRKDRFLKVMEQLNLPVYEDFVEDDNGRFEEAGYTSMNKIFERKDIPTAVIAAYDNIALGVMKSIYEHGLKIPDDISVIGFDNIKEVRYLNVPLTTITAFNKDLCDILVSFIFECIEKNYITKKTIKVSRQLIIRESIGRAPKR